MVENEWNEEITPPPVSNRRDGAQASRGEARRRPARRIKVLLIEDNRSDVRLIQELLTQVDGFAFSVECADRLYLGLARLALTRFDIVLLDLSLPDSRGLDTFVHVHALAPKVPIVVLSGVEDEILAVQTVLQGAEDYLVKGNIDTGMLVRSVRYAIERTRRRHAEQALRAHEVKLGIARQIQQKLFPAAPPSIEGFDIGGASHCAEATGGDYFDYFPMRDGALGIVIADVSGHGFGPALLMASTRAYLRALAQTYKSVVEILNLANQFLSDEIGEDCFVTLFFARLEPRTRSFLYGSAGHQTGCILDPRGAVKRLLESTGFPLGIDRACAFVCAPEIQLEPHETVVLLTDGITEARSAADAPFGMDRALDLVRAHRHEPAQAIVSALHQAVRSYCPKGKVIDDVTAIVIKIG